MNSSRMNKINIAEGGEQRAERNNRSGMNRIKGTKGIYKLECATINAMNIQVFLSPFTLHR